MTRYDYIVAGAGASGLSLLMHMIHSGRFTNKKILLVDRAPKDQNDRTWCFWEQQPNLFESIVHKKWANLWFHGTNNASKLHEISPYEYKMIRGIDFYNYCFDTISGFANIEVKYGDVQNIETGDNEASLTVNGEPVTAQYIFSSIPPRFNEINAGYFLWQHFKGWTIKSDTPLFDPDLATLMDFRINQKADCRFVYVMPFTEHEALVEFTVFSDTILPDEEYKQELASYCHDHLRLTKDSYSILATESGMIPMTNYKFSRAHGNIINIGTAGGQTKASTGYTFRFIQEHSRKIVSCLLNNEYPLVNNTPGKFDFYDSILLKILIEKKLSGADVFTKLMINNQMKEVFKFLDNNTSMTEDLKIIGSLPAAGFLSAAFSHLVGKN